MDETIYNLPEPLRSSVRAAWSRLPEPNRQELVDLIPYLSRDLPGTKDLLARVVQNFSTALGQEKNTIALVGPANVGKSTLYNQLITCQDDRAEVSPVPGTTRVSRASDAGLFTVMDTPGADAVGLAGEQARQIAMQSARAADFLVIIFEAPHGIKRAERSLYDELIALGKPCVVVLNKIDLVPVRDRERVMAAAAQNLGLDRSQVIETVATDGTNVARVVLAIAEMEPGLLTALANALPQYRARLAWQRIVPTAAAAATVAFVPLPLADIVPLLALQTGMVLTIARIYGYEVTLKRGKELIATFGMGFLARSAYRELSKFMGLPGWMLSSAIAASGTVAVGYAAMTWFSRGERPSRATLAKMMRDMTLYLKERLSLWPNAPHDMAALREQITAALRDLPEHLVPRPKEIALSAGRGSSPAGASEGSPGADESLQYPVPPGRPYRQGPD